MRLAAHAAWTSAVLSHGAPWRMRVERRFPALSSRCGHKPAHETKWPELWKRLMSRPLSAPMVSASQDADPRNGRESRHDCTKGRQTVRHFRFHFAMPCWSAAI
jgi:hypothetical protein